MDDVRSIILGVALVGCSISIPSGSGDDDTAIKDPPLGPVRPPTIHPPPSPSGDGMPPSATSRSIQCPVSQWIERHPDGSFREQQVNVALIPGIDPRSNYMIEQCEHIIDNGDGLGEGEVESYYQCPEGDTCSPVLGWAPYPIDNTHPVCRWIKGRFWASNLVVDCGHNWDDKAADGTVLAAHSDSWGTTILHTW